MSKRKTKNNKLLVVIFICAVILSAVLTAILVRKYIKNKNRFDKNHPGEISFLVTEPEHISSDQYDIKYADNEMLVVNPKINKKRVQNLAKSYNAKVVGRIEQTGDYQIQFENSYTREELEALCSEIEGEDIVESAAVNYMFEVQIDSVPYDINYGDKWKESFKEGEIGWNIKEINATKAWEFCNKNKGIINPVRIGVIDSTFYTIHEDLKECVVYSGYDNVGEIERMYKNGEIDYGNYAHGTHVFGTFAADSGDTSGICGIYPYGRGNTYLASWKGCTIDYTENNISIVAYKCYLAELILRNVKVINCSYNAFRYGYMFLFNGFESEEENDRFREENISEFYNCADFLGDYLSRLLKAGKDFVIVTSAGNKSNINDDLKYKDKQNKDASYKVHYDWIDAKYNSFYNMIDGDKYPEVYDRIIVVGSVDTKKKKSNFTCIGDRVDIYAPGEYIYSTVPGNKYENRVNGVENVPWSGTSMAAPQVAGVAAMVWSVNNTLQGDEVKSIVVHSSYNKKLEYKRYLNAYSAVVQAYESRWINKERVNVTTHKGGILGFVIDKDTDKGIENATVHVFKKATGDEYTATTDDAGHFEIFLTPGDYSIKVTASGYADYIWRDGTKTFLNVGNEEVYYLEDWIYMNKNSSDIAQNTPKDDTDNMPDNDSNGNSNSGTDDGNTSITWNADYIDMIRDVLPYLDTKALFDDSITYIGNLSDEEKVGAVFEALTWGAQSLKHTSENTSSWPSYYVYDVSDVKLMASLFKGKTPSNKYIDKVAKGLAAAAVNPDESIECFKRDGDRFKAVISQAGGPGCRIDDVVVNNDSVDIYYSILWQDGEGIPWVAHFVPGEGGLPKFDHAERGGKNNNQDGGSSDSSCYKEYAKLMVEYKNLALRPFTVPDVNNIFYGYALHDVNQDGTPELIMVASGVKNDSFYELLRMYTYQNGEAVPVIMDDYGKSYVYSIEGNKIRLHNLMVGTGLGGEAAFTFDAGKDELTLVEALSCCATEPNKHESMYYRVTKDDGFEGSIDEMRYFCFDYNPDSSFKGHTISYDEYKKGISGYDFIGLDFEVEDITDEAIEKVRKMN